MEFFSNVMVKILSGSGFAALPTDWRQLVMILVACVLLYLGIRKGFEPLLHAAADLLDRLPAPEPFYEEELEVVMGEEGFTVEKDGAVYVVSGASMDNLIRSVNFENEDSLNYFHRMLRKWGVIDALRETGAQEGDSVVIGGMEFDFVE